MDHKLASDYPALVHLSVSAVYIRTQSLLATEFRFVGEMRRTRKRDQERTRDICLEPLTCTTTFGNYSSSKHLAGLYRSIGRSVTHLVHLGDHNGYCSAVPRIWTPDCSGLIILSKIDPRGRRQIIMTTRVQPFTIIAIHHQRGEKEKQRKALHQLEK